MTTDYSRPSGYARWGWVLIIVDVALVCINLSVLATGAGSWANWGAAAFCAAAAVHAYFMWQRAVRLDTEHRAYMIRLRGLR